MKCPTVNLSFSLDLRIMNSSWVLGWVEAWTLLKTNKEAPDYPLESSLLIITANMETLNNDKLPISPCSLFTVLPCEFCVRMHSEKGVQLNRKGYTGYKQWLFLLFYFLSPSDIGTLIFTNEIWCKITALKKTDNMSEYMMRTNINHIIYFNCFTDCKSLSYTAYFICSGQQFMHW